LKNNIIKAGKIIFLVFLVVIEQEIFDTRIPCKSSLLKFVDRVSFPVNPRIKLLTNNRQQQLQLQQK